MTPSPGEEPARPPSRLVPDPGDRARPPRSEEAAACPPRHLDGVKSEAHVFYYDVYVRGLPEIPFLPCKRDSAFAHGAWVPYEECEEPPSPEELDISKVVMQARRRVGNG